jgi:uncharacterized protein
LKYLKALIILILAAGVYAWQVEPYWIEMTRHTVPAGLKAPVRLMVLSDLHARSFGRLELKVLKMVESEQPDLIVITGDCFTDRRSHAAAHQLLSKLKAPLGVWAVRGNWEKWSPVKDEEEFFSSAGVRLLVNANGSPRSDITLIGLDDFWSGSPDVARAERRLALKTYRIALLHAPGFFDQIAGRYPLTLAGHTHGGQIRLPGLPPLWLPGGCGRYSEGWYGSPDSRLYVTRGVGTSILPLRFFCRPEMALITLQ